MLTRTFYFLLIFFVDTDNDLASNGGYDNISVLCQPSNPTVEFLDILTNQIKITPENSPADCIH